MSYTCKHTRGSVRINNISVFVSFCLCRLVVTFCRLSGGRAGQEGKRTPARPRPLHGGPRPRRPRYPSAAPLRLSAPRASSTRSCPGAAGRANVREPPMGPLRGTKRRPPHAHYIEFPINVLICYFFPSIYKEQLLISVFFLHGYLRRGPPGTKKLQNLW